MVPHRLQGDPSRRLLLLPRSRRPCNGWRLWPLVSPLRLDDRRAARRGSAPCSGIGACGGDHGQPGRTRSGRAGSVLGSPRRRRSRRGPTLCVPAHAAISCSAASPGTAAGSRLAVATASIDEACRQRQQGQAAICQLSSAEQRTNYGRAGSPCTCQPASPGGLRRLFRLDMSKHARVRGLKL